MKGARALAIAGMMGALVLPACEREARHLEKAPQPVTPAVPAQTSLHPGAEGEGAVMSSAPALYAENNAYEISEGKRLFKWYNCNGCHASGGGGMGPPLMDEKWLYGPQPAQIFTSITSGRPNGMPAFAGRIPEEQVWQLVAYVRSMSGLTPRDAQSGRSDSMQAVEPESRRRPRREPQT